MWKPGRLIVAASVAAFAGGLALSAQAQAPDQSRPDGATSNRPAAQPNRGVVQPNRGVVQPNRAVQPNRPVMQQAPNAAMAPNRMVPPNGAVVQGRPAAPVQNRAMVQGVPSRVVVGEPGYRFGRPGVRREIRTFNERERFAWRAGVWHHERRFGRDGWWWEVNGAWYWYPQRYDGPPAYVSEMENVDAAVEADDYPDGPPGGPAVVGGYPPPPPGAYAPPPPPPPPPGNEAVGGAVGGAILGGVLGGVLTGRAGGAAAGAIIGGATGAAIGADAERRRNGYYWWHGNCYYRYPNGEYAGVAPGYCAY